MPADNSKESSWSQVPTQSQTIQEVVLQEACTLELIHLPSPGQLQPGTRLSILN